MHMWRRWSTTQNLCLTFIDELGNNYLKNCWSGPIKEVTIIKFIMLYFWKEKHMERALFHTCVPKILMMWSIVLEIECDSKNQNFEKMKKNAGDIIILHIVPKTTITIIWGTIPEIGSETDRIICDFGPFFDLLLH